jgi:V/A-type H+-transporting ATPase subunit I
MSALGAFVHSLRLQYVEFFSKFYVGGGKIFKPLTEKYEHINLNDK